MFGRAITAMLASTLLATTAQAQSQDQTLSDNQVEFLAEVLAMSRVCAEFADFHIMSDDLDDWMSRRLAEETDADIERVIAHRDGIFAQLTENASAVREMPRGSSSRQHAIDDHYAGLITRCNRMSNHSLTAEYFRKS